MTDILDALPPLRGRLTPNRPLADLSWLRVGGPADILFQPADIADLRTFMKACPPEIPVFPVGVGSNLIIRDGGIRGVVIRLGREFNGFEVIGDGCVRVGGSALDAQIAKRAAAEGLDLAFLRTIPGAIGGAIRMNAGCYGSYVSDVFVRATAVDRSGRAVTVKKDDMGFGYRHTRLPPDLVIVQAIFECPAAAPEAIEEKMRVALEKRAASQPVKERTAGSTFRNPAGFSSTGRDDDVHDLKAWKVIDDAGMRGARLGGAQMSEMHPNFLVNTGTATAADLENLGELVRKRVFETCGITLEWEIMRVGEKDSPRGNAT
ncbi:MAG: UDP-N-acetylmuramate dehydrogenase [Paracoccaceae bacterium]